MQTPSLDDIIAQYLTDVDSGEHPERERLMANHPQFAEALQEFFADLDQMKQVIQEKLEGTQDFSSPSNVKSQPVTKTLEDENRLIAKTSGGTKRIGNYKLLQRIGVGGMGEVWMAEQEKPVRRRVALKLIKAGMDSDQIVARFEAERQALAMMDHQNIAKVLDAGTTEDGRPYFVMELVQGISITQYCDKNKLSVNDRLNLFLPVCKAVHHAHQKGIIHRDLKPSNILVTLYDGKPVPKVIDFGLAKALQHQAKLTDKTLFTEFGQVVGTIQYMSPEQAEMNALDVDTRTDVYALGVLLYELLTGSTPIDRETLEKNAVYKVLETIREQNPPRPSARLSSSGNAIAGISQRRQIDPKKLSDIMKGDLDWIAMKALEIDRTRRYETATDFAEDVLRYLKGDVVEARPPSASYRIRKYVKKNKGFVLSICSIASLLVLATVLSSWFGTNEYFARKRAETLKQTAETESNRATKAEYEMKQQTKVAESALEKAEATLARTNLVLAKARWDDERPGEAIKLMESIPITRRGTDWNYARNHFEGSYATLHGHLNRRVISIDQSLDLSRLLSCGDDGLRIWNIETSLELDFIPLPGITQAVFSLTGNSVFVANMNSIDRIDIQSRSTIATIEIPEILYVAFDTGRTKAAALTRKGEVQIIDLEHMVSSHRLDLASRMKMPKGYPIGTQLTLDDRGNSVSIDGRIAVLVWDYNTDELVIKPAQDIYKFAGRSEDSHLVYGTMGGKLFRIKLGTEGEKQTLIFQRRGRIEKVSIDTTGRLVAAGFEDGTIVVASTDDSFEPFRLVGHSDWITDLVFSSDSQRLYSSSVDGTIKFWDLTEVVGPMRTVYAKNSITAICLADDEKSALVGTQSGKLLKVDLLSNEIIAESSIKGQIDELFQIPKSDLCALLTYGRLQGIDKTTLNPNWTVDGGQEGFWSCCVKRDGTQIITISAEGNIRFWESKTGTEIGLNVEPPKWNPQNPCISISPDGNLLAASAFSNDVQLWELPSGKLLPSIPRQQFYVDEKMQFSNDSQLIFGIGGSDINLWDIARHELRGTLRGHTGHVNDLGSSDDGKWLFSASSDQTIKMWDHLKLEEVLSFRSHTNSVTALDIGSTSFVSGSSIGHISQQSSVLAEIVIAIPIEQVSSVTLTKDCDYLAIGKNSSIQLHNARNGELLSKIDINDLIEKIDDDQFLAELSFGEEPTEIYACFHQKDKTRYLVWNTVLGSLRSLDGEPAGFKSKLKSDDGSLVVLFDRTKVSIVDNRRVKVQPESELGRSRNKINPIWHKQQAEILELRGNFYAAIIHRSFQLRSDPDSVLAWVKLRDDLANYRDASKLASPLPAVLSDALMLKRGSRIEIEDGETLNNGLWKVVSDANRSRATEYTDALQDPDWHQRMVDYCNRFKADAFLNTLGVSFYRRGEYSEAIEYLSKSLELEELKVMKDRHIADLPFLALSFLKSGNRKEAEKFRTRFESSMKDDRFNQDNDNLNFLREMKEAFRDAK